MKTFLPPLALAAMLVLAGCRTTAHGGTAALEQVDVVIHGGLLFDGEDQPGTIADVAIDGERIVAVGTGLDARYTAARRIDATGLVVAPGFIDPHTHPDTYIRAADPAARRNLPWLHQGVSTIFIGVDGDGTPDVAADLAWFDRQGTGTNLAAYVGLGPVRTRVMGHDDRAADPDELARMRSLVAGAMCEGALGLSTGLFYAPQGFTRTAEVVALAREAALRGGVYDTHQRDESTYSIGLLASVEETLDIGAEAGLPVHIAHIKALGTDVHGQSAAVIERINQARAAGQPVTADQYPWLASSTSLGAALLPRWAVDGGRPALFARLDDAATAVRIRAEMEANLRRRGGAQALLMIGPGWPWTGRTLADLAADWKLDPVDAALRVIGEGGIDGHVATAQKVASFNMAQTDVDAFMRQPWVMTASDGGDGHPRQYATFPEKYARFVAGAHVISLQDFIHRSSGLTARTFGLEDRGFLRAGKFADVVVFDPQRYGPQASYTRPAELSSGVIHLFVNGVPAIDGGQATDALPGRALRHPAPAGSCP
ncbi:amidohydrolase family protein [Pseudoxanthomonas sp.]|uniref:N-acyl-D-amino-acid deacylase family protein n=1 Tax=Pseudoxanthomonas sp. TaxID=1871049 RepID=UPI002587A2DF|nr:amidohydrolase family protein [Pseudoxanthomonas sp.]MCR6685060.1 amidohydrolase family protein [Pseudoxanthomonas sp.]